ncbi:hypothetical protein ABT116_29260 [Streptomyces sp. NPDC002130]|uniref:hypothetical protein n=1 Tax=Streptomyces sp. NPDC002130 TaxID=3155568 RepID=UPI00331FBFA1
MFDTALRTERALGLDDWQGSCPQISGISLSVGADESSTGVRWIAPLDAPAQSVDQRVKCAAWPERYEEAGGKLVGLDLAVGGADGEPQPLQGQHPLASMPRGLPGRTPARRLDHDQR